MVTVGTATGTAARRTARLTSRGLDMPRSRTKVITPEAAARLIVDHDTLAVGGFVGIGVPDELLMALAKRFRETGGPRDLTLVFAAGPGDGGARGLNRLAGEGLIRRAIGGALGARPCAGRAHAQRTDRGLLPSAGRDLPSLPRDGRRPPGPDHAGRARHLR